MVTITPLYGTATAITFTLASLASDTNLIAGRQSNVVANQATDDAMDALVYLKVTTGTTPTASRQIEVWLFGSVDGTTHSAGAGSGDANFSPTGEKTLMKLAQVIPTDGTSDHTYEAGPWSVAELFGGVMPHEWGVFVVHNTGVNLNATGGNHELKYIPVKYESA